MISQNSEVRIKKNETIMKTSNRKVKLDFGRIKLKWKMVKSIGIGCGIETFWWYLLWNRWF